MYLELVVSGGLWEQFLGNPGPVTGALLQNHLHIKLINEQQEQNQKLEEKMFLRFSALQKNVRDVSSARIEKSKRGIVGGFRPKQMKCFKAVTTKKEREKESFSGNQYQKQSSVSIPIPEI